MGRTNPKNMRRASLSSKLLSWWSLPTHIASAASADKRILLKMVSGDSRFCSCHIYKGKKEIAPASSSERLAREVWEIVIKSSLLTVSSIYVIFLDGRKMIKWKLELEVGFSVVFYFYSIAYIAFEPHSSWHGSSITTTTTTSFFRKLFFSFFFHFCSFSRIYLDQN